MNDWQPIATADITKRLVLLCRSGDTAEPVTAEWRDTEWHLAETGGYAEDSDLPGDPIAWCEPPVAPENWKDWPTLPRRVYELTAGEFSGLLTSSVITRAALRALAESNSFLAKAVEQPKSEVSTIKIRLPTDYESKK